MRRRRIILHRYFSWLDLLLGVDYRLYDVIPDGNNFVDFSKPLKDRNTPGGKDIYYSNLGGFVQGTKTLIDEKLKFTASLRFDKNKEFDPTLNPRFALVYTLHENHNFRASWQNGFRFPSLLKPILSSQRWREACGGPSYRGKKDLDISAIRRSRIRCRHILQR